MSHFITTHNESNQSVFSTTIPDKRVTQKIHGATVETVYTLGTTPPNLSSEDDIEYFANAVSGGGGPGGDNSLTAVIATFPPGAETSMHRTTSMNIGIVLDGMVELHLDSGEVRTMTKGDSYTQRGTMHKWKNVGDGELRLATFTLPVVKPVVVNGQTLETGSG